MADSNRGGWVTAVLVAVLTASSTPFWVRPVGEWMGVMKPTPTPTSGPDTPTATPTQSPRPAAARMSELMLNTNLHRHDLTDAGMERENAAVCAADCLANDQCHGMTFVAHPDAPGGVCWQKSAGAATESLGGMTSAYKIE